MKVVNLEQGSDEWLKWRTEGVTATDAVILLGLSSYKTQWRCWAEKTGFATPVDLSMNPLVRRGRESEDVARRLLESHFDDVLLPLCIESSFDPIIRASLDGLTSNGEPTEIKCPSEKVWNEVCSLGEQSSAFKMYYGQVQHQLLAAGSPKGYLVFYFDDDMRIFEIHADKALLATLYRKAKQFVTLVNNRIEPPKDKKKDLYIPTNEDAISWITHAEQYRFLDAEMQACKQRMKDLDAKMKHHLDGMKAQMGEYYHADYCGVMVTRYSVAGSVDYARMLEEEGAHVTPDLLERYRKPTSDRYRVTVSDSVMPRNIADEETLAPLEQADPDYQPFYF